MTRTFTNVGSTFLADTPDREAIIASIIDTLVWEPMPEQMPFSQGYVIVQAVQQMRMPRPTQVALNGSYSIPFIDGVQEGGVYSIYGIEAEYSNGRARVYVLDKGGEAFPLASDFWEKTQA